MSRPAVLAGLPIGYSAEVGGKISNRVKRRSPPRTGQKPLKEHVDKQGRRWTQVCSSMPEDEVNLYDAVAKELGIPRSALIRIACRQFCQQVKR